MICTFYARGNCKFGDKCKNVHQQPSQQGSNEDLTTNKPVYKFSSYSQLKNGQNLIDSCDLSPEELRFYIGTNPQVVNDLETKIDIEVRNVLNGSQNAIGSAKNTASHVNSIFGAQSNSSPFGNNSSTSAAIGTIQTPAFGNTASNSAFGNATSAFGSNTTSSAFGSASNSAFGTNTMTSAFGTNVVTPSALGTNTPSAFGTSRITSSAFGTNSPSAFGNTVNQSAFGTNTMNSSSVSVFGNAGSNTSPSISSFINTTNLTPYNNSSALGNSSAFGANESTSGFGTNTSQPQFGKVDPRNTSAVSSPFGNTVSTFGSFTKTNPSTLGNSTPQSKPIIYHSQSAAFGTTKEGIVSQGFGNQIDQTQSTFGKSTPVIKWTYYPKPLSDEEISVQYQQDFFTPGRIPERPPSIRG